MSLKAAGPKASGPAARPSAVGCSSALVPTLAFDEANAVRQEESQLAEAARQQKHQVSVKDPYPMRRIPEKVLSEDDYVEAVSDIIERDFFPDLPHLRTIHAIMEAKNAGDQEAVRDLEWKLAHLPRATPGATPVILPGATPAATPAATPVPHPPGTPGGAAAAGLRVSEWEKDDEEEREPCGEDREVRPGMTRMRLVSGKEVDVDLASVRLDDFQRFFTSEDNASFEAIVGRDLQRRREKEWWIEEAERQHNTDLRRQLAAIEDGKQPEEVLAFTEFEARPALSFHPDGLPQPAIEKPRVEFKNTRFTTNRQNEMEDLASMALRERKVREFNEAMGEQYMAMLRSGKFTFQQPSSGTGLTTPMAPPANNGYNMVKTPMMLPGVGGLSPLMTFGMIASTPVPLEEGHQPTFQLPPENDRDKAAEKLSRSTARAKRDQKQQTKADRLRALGLTPDAPASSSRVTPGSRTTPGIRTTPGSSAARVSPLSPIGALIARAQKMARKGGVLGIRQGSPPPTPVSQEPPRKRRRERTPATPPRPAELPASITDDLLKL